MESGYERMRQAQQWQLKSKMLVWIDLRSYAHAARKPREDAHKLCRHEKRYRGAARGKQGKKAAHLEYVALALFGEDEDGSSAQMLTRPIRRGNGRSRPSVFLALPAELIIAPAFRHSPERQFAHAAVKQGFVQLGIERNRAVVALERLERLLQRLKRVAAICKRERIIGFDDNRAIEIGERLFDAIEIMTHDAAAAQGIGEIGFQRDRGIVAGCRFLGPLEIVKCAAAIMQRFGVIGFKSKRAIAAFDRFFEASERHQTESTTMPRQCVIGLEAKRSVI